MRFSNLLTKLLERSPQRSPRPDQAERGQALLLVAVAFIGLAAFVGLAIDGGILFAQQAHLRRAVDAAALAAASQIREKQSFENIENFALEFIRFNGLDTATVSVYDCFNNLPPVSDPDYTRIYNDLKCSNPQKKLIFVRGGLNVRFSFLTLIGLSEIDINADAIAEAASLDLSLVLDISSSLAYETGDYCDLVNPTDGVGFDCNPGPTPATQAFALFDAAYCDLYDPVGDDPNYLEGEDGVDTSYSGGDGFPGDCHPFEEIKQAAVAFVQKSVLVPPVGTDRVAIVTFDRLATVQAPITNTLPLTDTTPIWQNPDFDPPSRPGYIHPKCYYELSNPSSITDVIKCIPATPRPDPASTPCSTTWNLGGNPSNCTLTSVGHALKAGAGEFGRGVPRQEALWVMILLTSGNANASEYEPGSSFNPADANYRPNAFCPTGTWQVNGAPVPCRDTDLPVPTRHYSNTYTTTALNTTAGVSISVDSALYDTHDYAYDMADFAGCPSTRRETPNDSACRISLDYDSGDGGQGAVIFAIGLGAEAIDNPPCDSGAECLPNAGERLMRYIAAVGDDHDPMTDPCLDPLPPLIGPMPIGQSCGNYFFAPSTNELGTVFEAIAARIFTRLTQ